PAAPEGVAARSGERGGRVRAVAAETGRPGRRGRDRRRRHRAHHGSPLRKILVRGRSGKSRARTAGRRRVGPALHAPVEADADRSITTTARARGAARVHARLPGRVSGLMRRPAAESSMSVWSRLRLVSSRLALMTHHVAALRYDGGCDSKNAQAFFRLRNSFSIHGSNATLPCSNEYRRSRSSRRFSNAASPAGRMRPAATRSCAVRLLTALAVLLGLRGVTR